MAWRSSRSLKIGGTGNFAVDIIRAGEAVEGRGAGDGGRLHENRRHEDHEFGFLALIAVGSEERAQYRQIAQRRDLGDIVLAIVLEQTGNREAVAAAELDRGFGSAHLDRRD